MKELHIALVAVGILVLLLGLSSGALKRTILSVPLLSMLMGTMIGPVGLGLLAPLQWSGDPAALFEEAAQLTMAIALMGVALRLPPRFMFRQVRAMAVLLGLIMPLMWLSSTLLVYWLLDLPLLMALLVAAVITPTDPIVATSIVTGKVAEENIPEDIRDSLSAESGANDGLAHPLVFLPLFLLAGASGEMPSDWLLQAVVLDVGGALAFGIAIGLAAGYLLVHAEDRRMVEQHSFLAYTVALSLLTVAGGSLLGINGILSVFTAGLAFDQVVGGRERAEEENVQEAFNQFFTFPIFVLFGMVLPWQDWLALGWDAVLLAVGVLLLRRLPAFLLLWPLIPTLRNWTDAAFAGWFGPIGVAALLYGSQVETITGERMPWVIASLAVFASLIAHGITSAPLTKFYGRRSGRPAGSGPESA